jgi:Tol biopolymer transport system component
MRTLRLLIPLLVSALVLGSPVSAGPAKSNGLISFGICCEDDPGIYVIKADGTAQKRILNPKSDVALYTAWSPNGERIAYVAPGGVWTMSPTGTDRKQVAKGRGETYQPTWSTNGKRIAFSDKYKKGKKALYVAGSKGGVPKSIYVTTSYVTDASWSPSGKLIMFTRDGATLWTVKPDGKGLKKIGKGMHPTWSPDSKRIAFVQNGDLWTMNANGTRAKLLVKAFANATAWSPDGKWIAYGGAERGDLRIIHPDGTGARQLTHQSGQFNSWPAWQPKP